MGQFNRLWWDKNIDEVSEEFLSDAQLSTT